MKYKNLNLKYGLINATFMMLVCATAGYAYNFLSQSGFADGTVGIIITLISICGLIGQAVAGSFVDKSEKVDEKMFISAAMIVTAVLALLMAVIPAGNILIIPVVIIGFTSAAIGLPFFNSLAFVYEKDGQKINYGLGRGIGSAAYAVGSSLLGSLWGWKGKAILPYYVIVFALLTFVLVRWMPTPSRTAEEDQSEETRVSDISWGQFFRKYSKVVMIIVSLVLLYFCHMMTNTYIAKIITNIIGDEAASVSGAVEAIQGRALFIQAMVELPTMFLFSQILKKVSVNKLMIIAAAVFSIKHALIWLSGSTGMLYAAMALQILGFALMTPAAVYFANQNVQPEDRNKGQAIFGAASTCGGLLASAIGGQLFQYMSTSNVIMIGVIASCIGTVLMFIGIRRAETE